MKWKVFERRVNQYIREDRAPDSERFGKSWAVPEGAEKPERQRLGIEAEKK